MAKQKGPGKPFAKGVSGNPKGSSKTAKQLKHIRAMTHEQILDMGLLMLGQDEGACRDIIKGDGFSNLQKMYAALIIKTIEERSESTFNVLLSRLIGRPTESVKLSGDASAPVAFRDMSAEDKVKRLEQLRRARETAAKAGK